MKCFIVILSTKSYLFAMYDENVKPTPPDVKKFRGLFHSNKQPKYDFGTNLSAMEGRLYFIH